MRRLIKSIFAGVLTLSICLMFSGAANAGQRQNWYLDSDEDGYGDPDTVVYTNHPDPGYILVSGDCDDGNSLINPDAPEVCNQSNPADENCNGEVNEGCLTWWQDVDGDRYSSGVTIFDTTAPATYVLENELDSTVEYDCADNDAAINPLAVEIIGDTIDQNCDGASFFADVKLEICVKQNTGGSLDPVDLSSLTSLDCSIQSIQKLDGLEFLTGLENLGLDYNYISDISSLANLTQLTKLGLTFNNVSDTSALGNLPALRELYLGYNPLGALPTVYNPAGIEILDMEGTLLNNISGVENFTGLIALVFNDNYVTDISPLANMSNLVWLVMSRNFISDLSPLATMDLSQLQWLNIDSNNITNIDALANLPDWCDLDLAGNCITNFSPVSHVTDISGLDMQCL